MTPKVLEKAQSMLNEGKNRFETATNLSRTWNFLVKQI